MNNRGELPNCWIGLVAYCGETVVHGSITMGKRILITGGAGFIGSHLADELLGAGYEVRVLDCLASQVHGKERARPSYLDSEVELISGDVRDKAGVREALKGVDAVFHLAAMVGVGQSMYEVAEYTSVNNEGTAVLLQALIEKPVQKLIVASSMSLYGEGLYQTAEGCKSCLLRMRAACPTVPYLNDFAASSTLL